MELYATLLEGSIACPSCGSVCTNDWQFHFGGVSSLPSYRLGDSVRWDGPVWFGSPAMRLVRALAYSVNEPACTACSTTDIIAELLIVDGILVELGRPAARAHARELLYEGEARVPQYHDDLWVAR